LELTGRYAKTTLMKLTRGDVERVALLARLQLSPEDEEHFREQLDRILEYMEKLNQLDTSRIDPFSYLGDMATPLREDIVTNSPNPDTLLANAPAQDNNFFRVPKIIE
jgi:aspartyl-tRNA(Asn)/glutamyl-tRNA(Gln) amidotransferase subunit C